MHEARRSLEAQGIRTYEPVRFDTGWRDTERDVFVPISSSAALPIHGQVPFMVDPYETRTLDGYGYEPWTQHANGVRHIIGVNGITRDVERDAAVMSERIFGVSVEYERDEVADLRRRDVALRIMSPAAFAVVYPGLNHSTERVLPHTFGVTLGVTSLGTTKSYLDDNAVPWVSVPGGIAVVRQEAHHTLLEFTQC